MKLTRHEMVNFGAAGAVLIGMWVVSLALRLIEIERVDIRLFVASRLGPMTTDSNDYVWNITAGMAAFLVLTAVAFGVVFAVHYRTYLGSGLTRRQTYARIATLGLIFTVGASALVALLWGVAALFEMPHIRGVSPLSLLLIPFGQISAYSLGVFATCLFVRFTWWKVVAGFFILQAVAIGVSWLASSRVVVSFEFTEAHAAGLLAASVVAAWALAWAMLRTLPMRR